MEDLPGISCIQQESERSTRGFLEQQAFRLELDETVRPGIIRVWQ